MFKTILSIQNSPPLALAAAIAQLAFAAAANPALEWNASPSPPVLGEFDSSHVGLEYRFIYSLMNATPGSANANNLLSLFLNAPNGKSLNYYLMVVPQGNLLYTEGQSTPTATFAGSIPPADYDPDNCITIYAYAPADTAVSQYGTISALSDLHGPFNTLTNVWVATFPAPAVQLRALRLSAGASGPGQANAVSVSVQVTNAPAFLLQYRDALTAANWTDLRLCAVTGAVTVATDTNAAPARFYRAVVP